MKRRFFGQFTITASTIRRIITIAVVFLLSLSVSAVIIVNPFKSKQKEAVIKPINPNKTEDEHYNDIDINDDIDYDPEVKIENEDEWSTSDSGSSSGGGSSESVNQGKIETIPGFIETISPVYYNPEISYTLITSEGSSSTGTLMYCITKESNQPSKSLFVEFTDLATNNEVKDVGIYSVWYYSKGNGIYQDTPLYKLGSFQIKGSDSIVTAVPTINSSLSFNNQNQSLLNTIGDSNGGTIVFGVNTTNSVPDKDTFVDSLQTRAKDPGTYYVWYYSKGYQGYEDTDVEYLGTCTITKLSSTITSYPSGNTLSFIKDTPQALISGASVANGTAMYALGNSSGPTSDYSSVIPTASAIGTYYIWWYVDGGDIYNGVTPTTQNPVVATINPVTLPKANYISPETVYGLTANGQEQNLITAGSSEHGTMKYSLGDQNNPSGNWTEDATAIKGKDPQTYYVWYYVEADGVNYNNSDLSKKIVTIYPSTEEAFVVNVPTAIDNVYYTGLYQEIVTSGSAVPNYLLFSITQDNTNAPDKSTFGPDNNKEKDPGTYYVWYYAKGDGVTYGDSAICSTPIEAQIKSPKATITSAPRLLDNQGDPYTYTGGYISLCEEGTTNQECTMKYVSTSVKVEPPKNTFIESVPRETEAGKYYVWYFSEGDGDHYCDSDVNCLEVEIFKAPIENIEKPIAYSDLEYVGSPVELIDISNASVNGGSFMYWATNSDIYYEDITSLESFSPNIPTANNPGWYRVYFYIKGDSNHLDSPVNYVGDGDFYNAWIQVFGDVEIYGPMPKDYPIYDDDGYPISNSYPVELLQRYNYDPVYGEFAGVFPEDSLSSEVFEMYYCVTNTLNKPSKNSFSTNTPTASGPGTYYVWYYGKSSQGSHRDTNIEYVISTVKDLPRFIITPSFKNASSIGTTYITLQAGQSISPVNAGNCEGGTIMYYLESTPFGRPTQATPPSKSSYSSSLPIISEPGSYRLWYYIKGDNNHTDGDACYLEGLLQVTKQASITKHPSFEEDIVDGTYTFNPRSTTHLLSSPAETDATCLGSIKYFIVKDTQAEDLLLSDVDLINKYRSSTYEYSSIRYSSSGSYTLCYFFEPSSTDLQYSRSKVERQLKFTINKEKITFGTPGVLADSRTYAGRSLPLFTTSPRITTGMMGQIYYYYVKVDPATDTGVAPDTPNASQFSQSYTSITDVGVYYVWYMSPESNNYAASDIVYAGRTEIISDGSENILIFTDPTPAQGLVYDGYSHSLINPGSIDETKGVFKYAVVYSPTSYISSSSYTSEIPVASEPGTYYVHYFAEGIGTYQSSSTYSFRVDIDKRSQSLNSLATPVPAFIEDGQYHCLVNTEPTSSGNTAPEYYVSKSNSQPEANVSWVSKDGVIQKDPGVYYVWYRCKETSTYIATSLEYITVTIKGRGKIEEEPTFINPRTYSNNTYYIGSTKVMGNASFNYQGSDITAITAGSSSTGTMKFKLIESTVDPITPNKSEITDNSVPTICEPGTYYIFYYSKSNSSIYEDSEIKAFKVTIEKTKISLINKPYIQESYSYVDSNGIDVAEKEYDGNQISLVNGSCTTGGEIKLAVFNNYNDFNTNRFNASYYHGYDYIVNNNFNNPLTPGEYYICYYINNSDETHYIQTDYTLSQNSYIKLIIKKGTPVILSEPVADRNITSPTVPTKLLTDPATTNSDGTIYYALTSGQGSSAPESGYVTSIDDIKAKDCGPYIVWYYVEETDLYLASETRSVLARVLGSAPTIYVPDNAYVYWDTNASVGPGESAIVPCPLVQVMYGPGTPTEVYFAVSDGPISDKSLITSTEIPTTNKPGRFCVSYYYVLDDGEESEVHSLYSNVDYDPSYLSTIISPSANNCYYDPYQGSLCVSIPRDQNQVYDYFYYMSSSNETPTDLSLFEVFDRSNFPRFEAGQDAGQYYVWWYGKDKTDGAQESTRKYIKQTDLKCVSVTLKKATPTFGQGDEPKGINYTYNGLSRAAVVPGNIRNSELQVLYYLQQEGDSSVIDKNNFSSNVPMISLPGTYTIYYYVKGNKNYEDSPIYSTVSTVAMHHADFNDLLGINEEYKAGGNILCNFDNGKLCENSLDAKNYKVMYALGSDSVAPDMSFFTEQVPKAYVPGTYYVWYYVVDIRGNIIAQDIKRATTASYINKSSKPIPNLPFISSATYVGNDIDLLSYDPTTNQDIVSLLDGREILYYVNYSNKAEFVTSLSTTPQYTSKAPKANAPGYYCVFYKTLETDKYYEYSSKSGVINIEIAADTVYPTGYDKPSSSISARELVYNGQQQSLLKTPGVSGSGTYYYTDGLLGTNTYGGDSDFIYTNANPPKQTEPGNYRVFYRLKYNNGTWGNTSSFYSYLLSAPSEIYQKASLNGEQTTRLINVSKDDGTASEQLVLVNKIVYEGNPVKYLKTFAKGDTNNSSESEADDGVIAYYVSDKVLSSKEMYSILSTESKLSKVRFNKDDKEYLSSVIDNFESRISSFNVTDNIYYSDLFVDEEQLTINKPGTYAVYSIAIPNCFWEEVLNYQYYGTSRYGANGVNSYDCQYVSVETLPCEIITHPQVSDEVDLFYNNGNDIKLLKSGGQCSEGGEIMFHVSKTEYSEDEMQGLIDENSGVNWVPYQESRPHVVGLVDNVIGNNVGKYFIYYFVKGDNSHSNSKVYSLSAEIKGDAPIIVAPKIEPYYQYTYYYDENDWEQPFHGYVPFVDDENPGSYLSINNEIRIGLSNEDKGSATYKGIKGDNYYLVTSSFVNSVTYDDFSSFKDYVKVQDSLCQTLNNDLLPGNYKLWYYFEIPDGSSSIQTAPESISFTIGKADLGFVEGEELELYPIERRYISATTGRTHYNFIENYGTCIFGGYIKYYVQNSTSPYDLDEITEVTSKFMGNFWRYDDTLAATDRDLYFRASYCFVPDVDYDPLNAERFNTSEVYSVDYLVKYQTDYDDPESIELPKLKAPTIVSDGNVVYPFDEGSCEGGWGFRYYFTKDPNEDLTANCGVNYDNVNTVLEKFKPLGEAGSYISEPGVYYAYVLAFNTIAAQDYESERSNKYFVYPHADNNRYVPIFEKNTVVVQKGKLGFKVAPQSVGNIIMDRDNPVPAINILKQGTAIPNVDSTKLDIRCYVNKKGDQLPRKEDMWDYADPIDPNMNSGVMVLYEPGEYYAYFMMDFKPLFASYKKLADPLEPYLAFKITISNNKYTLTTPVSFVDNPQVNGKLVDLDSVNYDPYAPYDTSSDIYYAVTSINVEPDSSYFMPGVDDPGNDTYWPMVDKAGHYYLWYLKKTGDFDFYEDSDVTCVEFTVLKQGSGYIVPDVSVDNVLYDGEAISVINNPFSVYDEDGVLITDNSVKVEYALSSSESSQGLSYVDDINDSSLKINSTGTYYLHYRGVKVSDSSEYVSDSYIEFEVNVATQVVPFTPPTANPNPVLDSINTSVRLINDGACNVAGSEFVYYITTFEDDIPSRQQFANESRVDLWVKEEGTYYVWYACLCRNSFEYVASEPACIEVFVSRSGNTYSEISPKGVVIYDDGDAAGKALIEPGYQEGYVFEYLKVFGGPDVDSIKASLISGDVTLSEDVPVINSEDAYGLWTIYYRKKNINDSSYGELGFISSFYEGNTNDYIENPPSFTDELSFNSFGQSLCVASQDRSIVYAYTTEYVEEDDKGYTIGPSSSSYLPFPPQASTPGTYYVWYRKSQQGHYYAPYYHIVTIKNNGKEDVKSPVTLKQSEFTYNGDNIALSDIINELPDTLYGGEIFFDIIPTNIPRVPQFIYELNSIDDVVIEGTGDYVLYYGVMGDSSSGIVDSDIYTISFTVKTESSIQAQMSQMKLHLEGDDDKYLSIDPNVGSTPLIRIVPTCTNGTLYCYYVESSNINDLPSDINNPPEDSLFTPFSDPIIVSSDGTTKYGVLWYYAKGANGALDSNKENSGIFEIKYGEGGHNPSGPDRPPMS